MICDFAYGLPRGFVVEQHRAEAPTAPATTVRADRVWTDLPGTCRLVVHRDPRRVEVHGPRPIEDWEWEHPLGTVVAACWALLHGSWGLHGAAVVVDGRAWVLLAAPGGGKSTLSHALDRAGLPVLSDDLALITDGRVQAGPRVIDLREPSARALGVGSRLESGQGRVRWRVPLGEAPAQAPLAGVVELAWGEGAPTLTRLGISERLALLREHDGMALGAPSPVDLLDLVPSPFLRLTRRRTFAGLAESVEAIRGLDAQAQPASA